MEIKIDVSDTIKKSRQLLDISLNISTNTSRSIAQVRDGVNMSWQGDAKQEYIKKLNALEKRINNRTSSLTKTVSNLKTSAEIWRRAEKMGVELFTRRL